MLTQHESIVHNLFRHAQRLPREGEIERFLVPSLQQLDTAYTVEIDIQKGLGHCSCGECFSSSESSEACMHIEAAQESFRRLEEAKRLQREISELEAIDRGQGQLTPIGNREGSLHCVENSLGKEQRLLDAKARLHELTHRLARLSNPEPYRWRLWLEGEALPREAYWHRGFELQAPNWHLPRGRGQGAPLTLEIALLYSAVLDSAVLECPMGGVPEWEDAMELPETVRLALRMCARWEDRVGVELYFED